MLVAHYIVMFISHRKTKFSSVKVCYSYYLPLVGQKVWLEGSA